MSQSRFCGLLLLALVGGPLPPAAQPGEWRAYRNERFGYELRYPTGWQVVEARPRADDAAHQSGDILLPGVLQQVTFREPEGRFWPGEFAVAVHEQAEGRTLDEWADASFPDVFDESLVTGAEDAVLGGRAARLFTVFGFDRTEIVVAVVYDGRIYEVGYTGTSPNDPDLAEHASIYEQMKRSFELVLPDEVEDRVQEDRR